MRIEATSLRQSSPSLRYFVLSETLHCAIIKFGNVIVSWLSIKFAFTLYCAIIKFGNVIVSRLSLKFVFTLHCAIIKFGNVIVSRLKFAFTSTVNKYNNNCLVHSLPGKLPSVIVTALASSGRYLDLGQYFPVKNGPNSYYCISIDLSRNDVKAIPCPTGFIFE